MREGTIHQIYDGMGKTRSQLWISPRKTEFTTIPRAGIPGWKHSSAEFLDSIPEPFARAPTRLLGTWLGRYEKDRFDMSYLTGWRKRELGLSQLTRVMVAVAEKMGAEARMGKRPR